MLAVPRQRVGRVKEEGNGILRCLSGTNPFLYSCLQMVFLSKPCQYKRAALYL